MPVPAIDTFDDLGGALSNLAGMPVENPLTDVDADADNRARCNVAAMTHTTTHAWVAWTGATWTGSPASVTPDDHEAVWGSSVSVRPTVSQTAEGVWLVTWPTTITDELGTTHTVNIRRCRAWFISGSLVWAQPSAKTAHTVTVKTGTAAGGADGLNGITIYCEIG